MDVYIRHGLCNFRPGSSPRFPSATMDVYIRHKHGNLATNKQIAGNSQRPSEIPDNMNNLMDITF